ncbi:MAG: arylsulfatase [Bacteroidota bacterium]
MRINIISFVLICFFFFSCKQETKEIQLPQKPNVIFIMVDDMGYGDLGIFGQQVLKTPNIDQFAKEGTVFTNVYAGSPVCAPSRSTLMTGRHTGHTTVRGNKSQIPLDLPNPDRVPLEPKDITIAEIMKSRGYITGMTGKWGLGEHGTTGEPNEQGFDEWLGYLNQARAHDHFPDYFWHNTDSFYLEGNTPVHGESNVTFSHDLFTWFALNFIEEYRDTTFFLYVPYTLPHGGYIIPEEDLEPFKDMDWEPKEKAYAGMMKRIDDDMGKFMKTLKEYGIDENTLVFFCSDNGAADRYDERFDSSGKLRGRKRDMYEGGIRSPMIVRMPGTVPAGRISNYPWYFPDVLPTLSELISANEPDNIDGISVLPEILGEDMELTDRFMYWEFHEGGYYQAVRWRNWKAVRQGLDGRLELYDLSKDEAETTDVSAQNPEIIQKITDYLSTARTESPYWKAK